MSGLVNDLRHTADDSAKAAAPMIAVAAGVGAVALGVVMLVKHKNKKRANELVGTLKKVALALQEHPTASVEALGALPANALREVIERKPTEPPLGTRLMETAVRTAVSTAVSFALKALKDRLMQVPSRSGGSHDSKLNGKASAQAARAAAGHH
ncbi:MAG: hypothetical protein ACRDJU_07835 [Actinomycetota bacterium]